MADKKGLHLLPHQRPCQELAKQVHVSISGVRELLLVSEIAPIREIPLWLRCVSTLFCLVRDTNQGIIFAPKDRHYLPITNHSISMSSRGRPRATTWHPFCRYNSCKRLKSLPLSGATPAMPFSDSHSSSLCRGAT